VGPVRLADALGWGSSLLGTPMIVLPRRFLDAIGVKADPRTVAVVVAVGAREQVAMLTVVAMRQRRIGIWSRAVGDTMDLALLGSALRFRCANRNRLLGAGALVAGLLVVDLVTAVRLSRAEGTHVEDGSGSTGIGEHDTGGGPTRVRTAVTIRRPEDEVRQAFRRFDWSAFDPAALEASGDVRFISAPGDRGTELHLDHEPGIRGGAVIALAAKATGRAPDQRISDELRRFKALLETGEVPRSETSPEGPSSTRQIWHKRQPAQPVGGSR
jgi:hypothetical protein